MACVPHSLAELGSGRGTVSGRCPVILRAGRALSGQSDIT